MRFSSFLVALPMALAAPIPSSYTWSFIDFNGDWYGVGYSNFKMSAPKTAIDGVTVPAIAFSDRCNPVNPIDVNGTSSYATDCSSKLSGGAQGRTLIFTLQPFTGNGGTIQYDIDYTFTSAGKDYKITGSLNTATSNTPSNFSITPSAFTET